MRLFLDLDGVLADFEEYMQMYSMTPEQVKHSPIAYRQLKPMQFAKDAVQFLEKYYDVWILSKPPTGNSSAWSQKIEWVLEHFPHLEKKTILTHDKSVVGCSDDILIDDRPWKANVKNFRGCVIHFKAWVQPSFYEIGNINSTLIYSETTNPLKRLDV